MLKFRFISKILFPLIIYSFPLVIMETFYLAFKRELMNTDEYLYPVFNFIDRMEGPFKYGLNRPNIRRELPHQNLFEYEGVNNVRYSKFETDKYGTMACV